MTLAVSPAYATEQANLQRTPIYKAKFANYDIPYATHAILVYLDYIAEATSVSEFFAISETKAYPEFLPFPFIDQSPIGDMFGFTAATTRGTSKAYASLFEGQQSQVFPEQGHASISSVTFVLTDVNGEVTDIVMSGILGERTELYAGFDGIDEDDYALFFTGVVGSIRSENLAGYEFTIYSPQSLVNRQVFNVSVTALVGDITDVATTLTVTSNPGESFLFQIDDEIISWSGYDSGTGVIASLTRGALGTTATEHAADAEVREVIRLGPAHPMDILLDLYMGTGKSGCGLSPSYVDEAGIAAAIPLIGSVYQMEFRITQPENAMQWAEREIFQPLGCYPVTKSDGKLSIAVFHPPSSDESVATIDHDSIVHDGQRPMLTWSLGRDGSLGQIINDVTWLFDYNVITGTFASSAQFIRQASIDRFGAYPLVIESRGLRTELPNTLTLLAARALDLLNRYENGAPVVQLTTILQKELIEPGEIISLTSDLLPNRATHTRGVTEALLEVVNRNIRFASGQVDFDLLWTSFADLARDDFNRANVVWYDDIDLNSGDAWSTMAQTFEGINITSNQLFIGRQGAKIIPTGGGHAAMVRTQIVGPNQSSQVTYRGVSGSGGFAGPAVRASFVFTTVPDTYLVSMSGYAAMWDSATNQLSLRLYNGTDPIISTGSELATFPVTLVNGDTIRIDARGSIIRVFLNDVMVMSVIDTVQTTNYPGILSNWGGAAGGLLFDDFVGGDSGWA